MTESELAAAELASLHESLLTLDTHIDIPWPHGPSAFEVGTRHVDLPKMRAGGLDVGFFAAYVPQQRRTPENEQAAYERAIGMLQSIRAMGASRNDITARVTATVAEIRAAKRDGVLGVVPCVENGFSIGSDLSRLREFRALGARYLTITHNGHNALADAAIPRPDLGDGLAEHGGLSALGRDAIGELNRLGMLVDVSHISHDAMLQAAAMSRTPVVATHSCVKALCEHPRNMDDEQLDVLKATGGVIQITAVSAFLRDKAKPEQVGPADFADHIDYAVNRIGIDHVGISSDFDGGGWFAGWKDASESANIPGELARRGYGRDALAALWGGNFLRVLAQAEEAADA